MDTCFVKESREKTGVEKYGWREKKHRSAIVHIALNGRFAKRQRNILMFLSFSYLTIENLTRFPWYKKPQSFNSSYSNVSYEYHSEIPFVEQQVRRKRALKSSLLRNRVIQLFSFVLWFQFQRLIFNERFFSNFAMNWISKKLRAGVQEIRERTGNGGEWFQGLCQIFDLLRAYTQRKLNFCFKIYKSYII